jgi:four helix bundle protein
MKIERFEDVEGWKQGRVLTKMVYAATRKQRFARDFGLKDQIQRASVSVMLNVAEGFDGGSNAEFVKFLRYGQRSCTEVQSALYVALDQEYISETEFTTLYKQAKATRALLGGFIKYLLAHPHPDA